jgi:hypothetical protein
MKDLKDLIKTTVLIFFVNGKRETHFGTNAIVLDSLFSNPNWLYSVNFKREQFENANLKIILIDIETEKNMALK